MSHKTFVIADTHFGHKGMIVFKNSYGDKIRPWETTEEMHEALIDNWK